MKILLIAPLPPPISGHSLAVKIFLDKIILDHQVEIVDLKKKGFTNGLNSFGRIIEIFKILRQVRKSQKNVDAIYFTISESLAGNIKDLIIYFLCFRKLDRMLIHLHGGSIKRLLFEKNSLLYSINKFFIKRLGGAIVLGESHVKTFSDILPQNKIYVVPNFAEDYLFIDDNQLSKKFQDLEELKILFLSNLINGKGFNDLLQAYVSLDDVIKTKVSLDFAGEFESESEKEKFLLKIKPYNRIQYHGTVSGVEKKRLLFNAQVFCLPTSLLEGQPISILEAYASGCVVVTTLPDGIADIFENEINGFIIQKKSPISIKTVIERLVLDPEKMYPIALGNRNFANLKFRISTYTSSMSRILNEIY